MIPYHPSVYINLNNPPSLLAGQDSVYYRHLAALVLRTPYISVIYYTV